jgi:SAM-dependent methyltransferase
MSTHEKETFFQTYDWAKNWQDLPWAHDEPTLFLANVCAERKKGKALDIGCGAGTDSVFLAQQGWDVTSLDFMPKALEYTQQRAEAAGVTVTPVEADITEWKPDQAYDLVLDHGLLHNMDPVRYQAYRETALSALADDGLFILLHWTPLYPDQPRQGKMGPLRTSREEIKDFFAPDLQERFFAREEFEDLPDMVGGGMGQAYYWFNRNQVQAQPAQFLEQIRDTLKKHDVDYEALIQSAGDSLLETDVSDELLCRILGPGRFGISHTLPKPGQVKEILAAYAAQAGQDAQYVENLFRIFASESHGNICISNARCAECSVQFCKRLRYR